MSKLGGIYSVIVPLRKLARNIARKVLRCIVVLSYDDRGIQGVQAKTLAGDLFEVPRLQEYGFTSRPHQGAEGVLLMFDESNALVLGVDDKRYRLKNLEHGEVALYDDEGTTIHIKRGGNIQVIAATKISFDTPLAEFSGDIKAMGDIKDRINDGGFSMQDIRNLYDGHVHGENGNSGPTNPPNQRFG